ncbi:NAD(P)/FAD-dependent oxidoreductase [Neobacillus niacini]|uniref:NAD(P)/FAD-dependent oxidoreductase n=1 Tax=Neobacillus niacini TaxID=86668 RepID=UPI0021CB7468|nr:NAD(P)/FAD-dependent oxidoreductase [Neobacillus niacini]MCM3766026.1 NAD(P)/FAD-dependent oxidoreductase [Neobacillus niacini]
METDVLIIGAGPAGLTAAVETASRGLDVTIVEESLSMGGQLIQQTQVLGSLPSFYQPKRGFELAQRLRKLVEDTSVRCLLGHRVIGFYKDGSVGISDEANVFPLKAKKIIVATGAAEKAIAFPKWTLPGIMTIGAAQTLLNRDFVLPGKHAVIIGTSDFAMDVALQLSEGGVQVKAMVEKSQTVLARDTEKVNQVSKMGIPVHVNSSIKEARGIGRVEEIDIEQREQIMTIPLDTVCVDGGRSPILDVFYQLECSFGYQRELGGWIPQYNPFFRTDREDVFLAGNAAGVSSQGVLLVTGIIAGINASESLGALSKEEAEIKTTSLWKEIETLETKLDPDVWNARIRHVQNYEHPVLTDQFIS